MGKYLITSAAATLLIIALSAATSLAYIPLNGYFRVPPNHFGRAIAEIPDPPAKVISGTPPEEPTDPYKRVYECWGYLGKPQAVGWVKLFFINGTLPGRAVCQGVLRVHRDCWPDMFKVWYFVNVKRIFRLRRHCLNVVRAELP